MSFKTRLFIGFGFIIMLMIILLYSIISMLNNQNRTMNEIVEDRYRKIHLAHEVRYGVSTIGKEINESVFLSSNRSASQRLELIEAGKQQAAYALQELKQIIVIPQAKQMLTRLNGEYLAYVATVDQLMILDGTELNEQIQEKLKLAESQRINLINTAENIVEFQEQVMDQSLLDFKEAYRNAVKLIILVSGCGVLVGILIAVWIVRGVTARLYRVKDVMASIVTGEEQLPRAEVSVKDEIGEIAIAFNEMAQALEDHTRLEREYQEGIKEQGWLKAKLAEFSVLTQGLNDRNVLGCQYLSALIPTVNSCYGVIYVKEKKNHRLFKLASYADPKASENEKVMDTIGLGEGLIGQCAVENKFVYIENLPENYIRIKSGLGSAKPTSLFILPIAFEGEVLAVIEVASFNKMTSLHQSLLEQASYQLGIAFNRIEQYTQVQELLKESQTLNEELQSQSEELQLQQEELRTMNEELEAQYKNSEQKTKELEEIKLALEEKARAVVLGSKYKSEFLANMSHELRTPLNSLLILAHMLLENKYGNLTEKQLEYVGTIYSSGNDLLQLINDILDLSKIESGKMDIQHGEVDLAEIMEFAERQFLPVARQKGIDFTIGIDESLPGIIYTDEQRLCQILKNLLSNAFKFTERGNVHLQIAKASQRGDQHGFLQHELLLAFSVTDTGVGISPDKQDLIFEAFRQADGTTSRKYGGTGLGLSICKELAQLLGGFIEVQSVEGKGSTFTFFLPSQPAESVIEITSSERESAVGWTAHVEEQALSLSEERTLEVEVSHVNEVLKGKKVMVVDDDMRNIFALSSALEGAGMDVIFAENGREALELLMEQPDVGIILMDIMMPEMDGYEAMQAIRHIPEYRGLPIIALTAKAMKNDRQKCMDAGASDYISKPVNLDQLFSLLRVWLYQ
ncbi:response regulator [Ammoniphilus sp. YIM 78166]|uniref:response regulator n=1 Tax=Ammoniphilus sp. YIM 78166 TaxID=1644106 RepID=UPI00106F83F7|nr:response regulator [Ammoniphilus sp. YIM 78166]